MELTEKYKKIIKNEALKTPDLEICGLFYLKNNKINIKKCLNIAPDPKNQFIISAEQRKNTEKLGKIIGFYHSHPDGNEFSEIDKLISEKLNLICVLYCNKTDEFKEYMPCGYQVGYIGRPFLLGIMDCLQLVRDYYSRDLNIEIPDAKHPVREIFSDWKDVEKYNKKENKEFLDFFLKCNFVEVSDLMKNDVLLCKLPGIKCACHCAIYLGNDMVLHHLPSDLSKKDNYGWLKKYTLYILRHKNLIQ